MAKVSELSGALLDYWVACAGGLKEPEIDTESDECVFIHHEEPGDDGWYTRYAPSTTWSEGGPLIEKYDLFVDRLHAGPWISGKYSDDGISSPHGDTPLVAVCRAVVRSVFGDEVEDVA